MGPCGSGYAPRAQEEALTLAHPAPDWYLAGIVAPVE